MEKTYAPVCILLLWATVTSAARDVIVIGAGASGLAAARQLTDEGGVKVTVLEARANRYGGRIWTNAESFTNATGPEVDMGASFIHYPGPNNSVVQLCKEFKIPMIGLKPLQTVIVREKDGASYTLDRAEAACKQVRKSIGAAVKYAKTQETDSTLRSALWKSNNAQKIGNPLSQYCLSLLEVDNGAPIDNTSAAMYNVGYGDRQDQYIIPSTGYSRMLDMLVQRNLTETPLDIHLGQEVTKVVVQENRRVRVTCRDGSEYEADAVIVTLPLGVLKANVVSFMPKLPRRKLKAIRRLGFGVINKIVLEFDRVFWPRDKHSIGVAMKNVTERGDFSTFVNFVSTGRPVLVSFAGSYFGKASESLSDQDLKTVALARLRTIYGNVMDTVTVVNMARSRWLADPFSRGVYSFPAVGVMSDDWDRVGEPVPPLFFAGEHTRTAFYGTVQTALDTGRRAATQAADYLDTLKDVSTSASNAASNAMFSFNSLHLMLLLVIVCNVVRK